MLFARPDYRNLLLGVGSCTGSKDSFCMAESKVARGFGNTAVEDRHCGGFVVG